MYIKEDEKLPEHFHRKCVRCKHEWMERVGMREEW
jgi:hypothetical protein